MNKTLYSIDMGALRDYQASMKEYKDKCTLSSSEMKAFDGTKLSSIDSMYNVSEDKATINVIGVLKPKLTFWDVYFDSEATSYDQIIRAIDEAESNPEIKTISMFLNSPGGYVSGMSNVADRMRQCSKPINGLIGDLCASACYFIASQCREITCQNEFSEVGSVGIMITGFSTSNDDIIEIRSKNAPFKALSATDPLGYEKIQKNINNKEEIFINYISEGRSVSSEDVKADFGQGDTMLATEAINAKMVDNILHTISAKPSDKKTLTRTNATKEESKMDAKEVKASIGEALAEALKPIADALASTNQKIEDQAKAQSEAQEKTKAEAERKEAFAGLIEKFPKQKAMIDESLKAGKSVDADLMAKVSESEIARVTAELKLDGDKNPTGDGEKPKADGKQELTDAQAFEKQMQISDPSFSLKGVK